MTFWINWIDYALTVIGFIAIPTIGIAILTILVNNCFRS